MMEVFWLEESAADVPPGDEWLTPAEMRCLRRMRFEKRRADWRLGRWTAKCALAYALSIGDRRRIEIRAAPSGAPQAWIEEQPAPVTISLSHSAGIAVCAATPSAVALGCDLERIEPRTDAFVADYFTATEQAMIRAAPPESQLCLITLLWSAKESALKALQTGLRIDTRSVEVEPQFESPTGWRPLEIRCAGGRLLHGSWKRNPWFVFTLAADAPVRLVFI